MTNAPSKIGLNDVAGSGERGRPVLVALRVSNLHRQRLGVGPVLIAVIPGIGGATVECHHTTTLTIADETPQVGAAELVLSDWIRTADLPPTMRALYQLSYDSVEKVPADGADGTDTLNVCQTADAGECASNGDWVSIGEAVRRLIGG